MSGAHIAHSLPSTTMVADSSTEPFVWICLPSVIAPFTTITASSVTLNVFTSLPATAASASLGFGNRPERVAVKQLAQEPLRFLRAENFEPAAPAPPQPVVAHTRAAMPSRQTRGRRHPSLTIEPLGLRWTVFAGCRQTEFVGHHNFHMPGFTPLSSGLKPWIHYHATIRTFD